MIGDAIKGIAGKEGSGFWQKQADGILGMTGRMEEDARLVAYRYGLAVLDGAVLLPRRQPGVGYRPEQAI